MKTTVTILVLIFSFSLHFSFGQQVLEEVVVAGKKIIIYDNNTWSEKLVLKRHTLRNGTTINIYPDNTWEKVTDVQIGERLEGGEIVCYLLKATDPGFDPLVQKGLVLAPDFGGTKSQWYCTDKIHLADAYSNEDGLTNSMAIRDACEPSLPPAAQCLNYGEGWYLPSMIELSQINLDRDALKVLRDGIYWSSTVVETTSQAFAVDFSSNSGSASALDVGEEHYFFPVKKFERAIDREIE